MIVTEDDYFELLELCRQLAEEINKEETLK
jgi:hypothetical protein